LPSSGTGRNNLHFPGLFLVFPEEILQTTEGSHRRQPRSAQLGSPTDPKGIPAVVCAPSSVSSALNNYLLQHYPPHIRKMPEVVAQDAR
jgi:hypothetical protein